MDRAIAEFIAAETGKAYRSGWITVDQARINRFADVTQDHNFLHVDPAAAKEAGLDGTIAHGFLTLSLLAPMRGGLERPKFPHLKHGLNYGLDGVRFLTPVPSGGRIRGHFTVEAIDETRPGHFRETMAISVELEGAAKPALVARWLTLYVACVTAGVMPAAEVAARS